MKYEGVGGVGGQIDSQKKLPSKSPALLGSVDNSKIVRSIKEVNSLISNGMSDI